MQFAPYLIPKTLQKGIMIISKYTIKKYDKDSEIFLSLENTYALNRFIIEAKIAIH